MQDSALLIELHEIPVSLILQLVEVSLDGSTTLPVLCHLQKLRVEPCYKIQNINETIEQTGPSIDMWGAALVTGIQLDFAPLTTILSAWLLSQFLTHVIVHPSSP